MGVTPDNTTEQGALDMVKDGAALIRRGLNYVVYAAMQRAVEDPRAELARESRGLRGRQGRDHQRIDTLLGIVEEYGGY